MHNIKYKKKHENIKNMLTNPKTTCAQKNSNSIHYKYYDCTNKYSKKQHKTNITNHLTIFFSINL